MRRRRARVGARRLTAAVGKFAAISIAFVAVLLASGYISMRLALIGRGVKVPDVTGMTVPEARAILAREELTLEGESERHDDRLERGRILAQDPPAGAALKKFRKVRVITSLGPQVFAVPDLTGRSIRAATLALEGAGLRLGRVARAHTLDAGPDVVVAQDPQPTGESVGESGVSLLVSHGPREPVWVMPEIVGLTIGEVRPLLEKHGLRLGAVQRDRGAGRTADRIVRQNPDSGWPVSPGDVVSLVVGD